MLTRGDRWKEDFQKCLLPGTSPARETARGDTTDGNREKPLNLPVYRERKKKKRKKGKKEDRERGRGLDSTDELCERMYIRGKLTGDNSIASWIASAQQSPPTGNYHGGKGRRVEGSNRRFVPPGDKKKTRSRLENGTFVFDYEQFVRGRC